MTTIADGPGYASFSNNPSALVRDVSPLLLAALNKDSNFLALLNKKAYQSTQNRKVEWERQKLAIHTLTVAGAGMTNDPTNTAITVTAGQEKRVRQGDLVHIPGGEMCQVVSTDEAAHVVNVTRAYGGSVIAAHIATTKFNIMPSRVEYSSAGTDQSTNEDFFYNYTHIMDAPVVQMSGTQLAMQNYNIRDKFQQQLNQRTLEFKKQLADAFINSRKSAAPASGVTGSMAGLLQWLSDPTLSVTYEGDNLVLSYAGAAVTAENSDQTLFTGAETFNYETINSVIGRLEDRGAELTTGAMTLIGRRPMLEQVYNWGLPATRLDPGQAYFGYKAPQIMTKQGHMLSLVSEVPALWPANALALVDMSLPEAVYVAGRNWITYTEGLGTNLRDGMATRVLGEWSLRFHGVGERHALFTNISY